MYYDILENRAPLGFPVKKQDIFGAAVGFHMTPTGTESGLTMVM